MNAAQIVKALGGRGHSARRPVPGHKGRENLEPGAALVTLWLEGQSS